MRDSSMSLQHTADSVPPPDLLAHLCSLAFLSLPGLTRQSIFFGRGMDPRVKPAGDEQAGMFHAAIG
jgi:hypothetical protein